MQMKVSILKHKIYGLKKDNIKWQIQQIKSYSPFARILDEIERMDVNEEPEDTEDESSVKDDEEYNIPLYAR